MNAVKKKWTIIRFPLAWSLHPAQGGVFTRGEAAVPSCSLKSSCTWG